MLGFAPLSGAPLAGLLPSAGAASIVGAYTGRLGTRPSQLGAMVLGWADAAPSIPQVVRRHARRPQGWDPRVMVRPHTRRLRVGPPPLPSIPVVPRRKTPAIARAMPPQLRVRPKPRRRALRAVVFVVRRRPARPSRGPRPEMQRVRPRRRALLGLASAFNGVVLLDGPMLTGGLQGW